VDRDPESDVYDPLSLSLVKDPEDDDREEYVE
jgi:hypothetical protein